MILSCTVFGMHAVDLHVLACRVPGLVLSLALWPLGAWQWAAHWAMHDGGVFC